MGRALTFSDEASAVQIRIVGTWKLVSTEERLKDGSVRPFPQFGPHAKGFLMYQLDGYMCAVLVPDHALAKDKTATDGTFAYCGRYEVDAEQRQIVHLPQIASNKEFVGSRQVRPYQFEEEHLVFSDIEKNDPEVERWRIVWEKC